MTDQFLAFMLKKQAVLESFGAGERERLMNAILSAPRESDKSLLEATAKANEETRLETQNALSETLNFVSTFKQIIGSTAGPSSCEDLTCGEHAHCAMDSVGARCSCNMGFQGNGFVCRTPLNLSMTPILIQSQSGPVRSHLADLRVATLQGNVVVAVYRDVVDANKGYVMLGRAASHGMQWHPPVLFSSQSQAFSPVVVQLAEDEHGRNQGGIAIAFRDANRGGNGILVTGKVNSSSGDVTLGVPKAFARHQAQAMSMVPLPDSRVAVIFAEHLFQGQAGQVEGGAMYGAALLAQVSSNGSAPEIISKDRFAVGPVARFSVAALSPTSFGVAYRQGGAEPGSDMAEAACIVGELHSSHIRFNSAAVLLEPTQAHILARSLTLVGKNTIAYTYHSANEKVTKQAILRADPKNHRLEVVHGPVVLSEGLSPVIGSIAAVTQEPEGQGQDSLLLTVLGHDGPKPAEVRFCRISKGTPSACLDLASGARNLASVAATEVSDGRFVILMTDTAGSPHYQIVGLAM